MTTPTLLLFAAVALCAAFTGIYFLARLINNYGTVDIAWAYAFTALATFYALEGSGWTVRRALVGAMVGLWSLRLGSRLVRRVAGRHPEEDARYRQLRLEWKHNFTSRMFGCVQLRAISVVCLGLPFLLASQNPTHKLHPLETAGLILWLLALTGEGLADTQLDAFNRNPANAGRVCDVGLWRYSRHPNYFFEWLVWVAFFVFASASPWGWMTIVSPLTILFLLLRVTGIPLAEKQCLQSKGDAYRRYQITTHAFIPWFRRPPTP